MITGERVTTTEGGFNPTLPATRGGVPTLRAVAAGGPLA